MKSVIATLIFFTIFYIFFHFFLYILGFSILIVLLFIVSFKQTKKALSNNSLHLEIENLYKNIDKINLEKEIDIISKHIFKYNILARKMLKIIIQKTIQNKNIVYAEENKANAYYEIFEITEQELSRMSKQEVNKKYKNLSKIYHPDKPTGDKDKMAILNNAKEYFYAIIKERN